MSEITSESEQRQLLRAWSDALLDRLGLPDVDVDIDEVLGLAGVAAHAVVRPAAPLTTYLVGIAVGRATAGAEPGAFAAAAAAARALAGTGDYAP